MYALEPEPEKRGRLQRFGVGGAIVLVLGVVFVLGVQHIEPAQRLLAKVVPFAVVDVPPPRPRKTEPEPPPPPKEEQPKPKPKPEPKPDPTAKPPPPSNEPPPPSDTPPKPDQPPGPEAVGLNADSFGSGSGPSFHMGTTQMGVPTGGRGGGGGGGGTAPVDAPKVAPKVVEAKPRPGNRTPPYPERARRLNIEGLVVVEADINQQGKVTRAVVRRSLDPILDEEARKAVLAWQFEPATLLGKPVDSTKFLRIRFQLE